MPIASPKYPFTRAALYGAPRLSGVYALYDGDELIYVGCAELPSSIQAKLVEHHLGVRDPSQATHYSWEVCQDPPARQNQLIREFQKAYQRPPRHNVGPCAQAAGAAHLQCAARIRQ